MEYLPDRMLSRDQRCNIRGAYGFLEKSKYPYSLQEIIQIVVKIGSRFRYIHIGMELLRIGLNERWFLQSCVDI